MGYGQMSAEGESVLGDLPALFYDLFPFQRVRRRVRIEQMIDQDF